MSEKVNRISELRELYEQTYGEEMVEMFFPDLSLALIIIMDNHQFDLRDLDFEDKSPAEIQKSLRENGLLIDPKNSLFYRTLQTELMDLKEPELS